MIKFNLKAVFLIGFPLSLILVRGFSLFGFTPLKLAEFSPLGCPVRILFGILCPTCGLTRSLLCAWNGDYNVSMRYHFGGILILVLAILLYFILITGRQILFTKYVVYLKASPTVKFFWATVIFLYSFWGFFLRSSI